MDDAWIEKLAIQELCSRYSQTIDTQDAEGWAQCFLPDAAFGFDSHVVRGRQALHAYADAHTRVMRFRHMTLNHLYDVSGNHATGRATTVVSIATPSGFKIMGQGAYQDDIGAWELRHRRVVNDHLVSDPTSPVGLADPDGAVLLQTLIDTANNLARRAAGSTAIG